MFCLLPLKSLIHSDRAALWITCSSETPGLNYADYHTEYRQYCTNTNVLWPTSTFYTSPPIFSPATAGTLVV